MASIGKNKQRFEDIKYTFVYSLYWLYELLFKKVLLNNYGYFPSSISGDNAYQFQFYLELVNAGEITTNEALDIGEFGCGQGHGGMYLLKNCFHEQSRYTGIDSSSMAIRYCRWKWRKIKNATFINSRGGKALANESFDLILSVETSIPSSGEHLREMYQYLKPSGLFVFYETYKVISGAEIAAYEKLVGRNGFAIVKKMEVTSNIVQSLVHDNERKLKLLKKLWFLPRKTLNFLKEYVGAVGSENFDNYCNNKRQGMIYVLRKLPELCVGYIDLWDNAYLHGWAFHVNQDTPVTVQLSVNGNMVAEATANQPRPDVARVHGKNKLNSGFTLPLSLKANASYNISVTDAKTGLELDGGPLVINT